MESFWNWKWLMHANARALFIVALLILLLVLGWCGWVIWQPRRPAPMTVATSTPAAPSEESIGLLDFLERQLDAGALVVPVNPFRPTLESLAANQQTLAAVLQHRRGGGGTTNDPFASMRGGRNVPNTRTGTGGTGSAPPAMRTPRLTYRGFFQRPDGKIAALFSDSTTAGAAFLLPGDTIHGVTLLPGDGVRARVRTPDGEARDLAVGESVTLPEEAAQP